MAITIGIAWLILMALGMPIAFVVGLSGMVGVILLPDGTTLMPALVQHIFHSISSFNFIAIPLFVFAGGVLSTGGIAKILMDLATLIIGHGRGGLGAAIVGSSMVFHGISGSSSADAAAIGRVMIPTMREQHYPVPFTVALLATSGATGALIPPTNDLILIGIVGNMSIAGLFAAGILPACVNGLGLMALVLYISRRCGYGTRVIGFDWRKILVAFVKSIPALFTIVIILGGILGGAFTPTEAAAVTVVYSLFIAFFVYRSLTFRHFLGIFRPTIELSGIVLLMIAMASMLGYALTIYQLPQHLGTVLDVIAPDKVLFLLFVQICFYLIGTCMDTTPAILILIPILTPLAITRGIEPIHFGILVECNVVLHLACPPVGNILFAACAVGNTPLELVIKPILPMIGILTVTMLIITYVPEISMYLPRLLDLVD
jgi:tripartite ATP-independent transporter DctM subunit